MSVTGEVIAPPVIQYVPVPAGEAVVSAVYEAVVAPQEPFEKSIEQCETAVVALVNRIENLHKRRVVILPSLPKTIRQERDPEAPKGPIQIAPVLGSRIHGAVRQYAEHPETLQERIAEKHEEWSLIELAWERVIDDEVAPDVVAHIEAPTVGEEMQVAYEMLVPRGEEAVEAAGTLNEKLLLEQDMQRRAGLDEPGPLEQALRLSRDLNLDLNRRSRKGYREALSQLPKKLEPGSFPLTQSEAEKLMHQARSYHFVQETGLLSCTTIKPDAIRLCCGKDNVYAHNAGAAFIALLKTGIGFDAEALHETRISFTSASTGEEYVTNGLSVMHWVATAISEDKLKPVNERGLRLELVDIKAQMHAGKKWNKLDQVWKRCGWDIRKVFTDENITKYADLEDHFNEYQDDLACTVYAIASWIRFGEKEYHARYKDAGERVVRWEELVSKIDAFVALVDFNVTQRKKGRKTLPSPPDYHTYPPLSTLSVPETTGVYIKKIGPRQKQQRVSRRGAHAHGQVKAREMSKLGRAIMAV